MWKIAPRLASWASMAGRAIIENRKLERRANSTPTPSLPPRCILSPLKEIRASSRILSVVRVSSLASSSSTITAMLSWRTF